MLVDSPLDLLLFFFNDTATTEIYTLSLHDALPICGDGEPPHDRVPGGHRVERLPQHAEQRRERGGLHRRRHVPGDGRGRSEEHTSELQSRLHLVCRLLLEKKKKTRHTAGEQQSDLS